MLDLRDGRAGAQQSMFGRARGLIRPLPYPAIDGLRFYAAFAVFFVHMIGSIAFDYLHTPTEMWNRGTSVIWIRCLYFLSDGHHGVDVFFIISGFLMGRIVMESRQFSYGSFIWRRFLRIYPAFLASLFAATLLAVGLGYRFDF